MDYSKIYSDLEKLGPGLHKCGWFGGWISVKKNGEYFDVMWTTGKTMHTALLGTAVACDFSANGYKDVMRSILSMCWVYDKEDQKYYANWLAKKIEKAAKRC